VGWRRSRAALVGRAHRRLPGRGGDLDVEAALELGAGPRVTGAAGPAPVGLRVAYGDEGAARAEPDSHAQEHGGRGRGRVGGAVHDRPVAERTGGLPLAAGLVDGDGGVAATGLGADPDGVELSPVVRQEVQCDEVPLLVVAVVGNPAHGILAIGARAGDHPAARLQAHEGVDVAAGAVLQRDGDRVDAILPFGHRADGEGGGGDEGDGARGLGQCYSQAGREVGERAGGFARQWALGKRRLLIESRWGGQRGEAGAAGERPQGGGHGPQARYGSEEQWRHGRTRKKMEFEK